LPSTEVHERESYSKCAVQDGLTPVLEKIEVADALILGSPIYFGKRKQRRRTVFPQDCRRAFELGARLR